MATEHDPAMPDLRSLRLAYMRAVAENMRWEDEIDRQLARNPWGPQAVEIQAGRAFLAALQEEDPACSRCGCTQFDPCEQDDGPCEWTSADPVLCSACAGHRPAWVTTEVPG